MDIQQDESHLRLLAAEKAYQEFKFEPMYSPSSAGEWRINGSNFTRALFIVYDAEESVFEEGEFGLSFAEGQVAPDQFWANVGRKDISLDGSSVSKRNRRGYAPPATLFDFMVDVAEQAYVEFEFADGFLPCGQSSWKDVGGNRFTRAIFISGGEEEMHRVGLFQVTFSHDRASVAAVSASLDGRDLAYRPRRGRSLSRPWLD